MVSKKAVSLMVSYVILISIAIGLSIGVYAWLKDYTLLTEKIDCKQGTSLFLEDYNLNQGIINLSLKNNGYFNIDGFMISASNDSNRAPIDLLNATGAGTEGFPLGHYYFRPPDEEITDMASSSLIAEWKLDGNVEDSAGENDGTINGNPQFVDAKVNQGLEFDGVGDYVVVPDDNSLNFGTGSFSLSAWVKRNSYSLTGGIISKEDLGNNYRYLLADGASDGNIEMFIRSGSNFVATNKPCDLSDSAWHHLVMVVDRTNNEMKLYCDDSQAETTEDISGVIGVIDPVVNLQIGERQGGSQQNFNGTIDEVKIFNKALSEEQVKSLYNSAKVLKPTETKKDIEFLTEDFIKVIQIQPFIWDKKGNKVMCEQAVIKQDIYEYVDYIYSFTSLVSWWKFDDNMLDSVDANDGALYGSTKLLMSLDEGSGNPEDSSAYNNDGTITGATWQTSGCQSSSCLDFGGAGNYVQIPDSTSLDITQDLTIIAWVNSWADYSTGQYTVSKDEGAGFGRQFGLYLTADDIYLYTFGTDLAGASGVDVLAGKENQWIFVAGTIDSSGNVKLYLDGSDVTSADNTATPITTAVANVYIGARGDGMGGSATHFSGSIDEVAIYNKVLTPTEISSIYTNSKAKFIEYVFGKSGNALEFDGVNDYIEIGDSLELRLGVQQTIEAWVKINGYPTSWARVVGKGEDSINRNYGLWYDNDGDALFQIYDGLGGTCNALIQGTSGIDDLSLNTWYFLTGTYNGTMISLYVNDELVYNTSCTIIPANSANPLIIGKYGITGYVNGTIDDVMIFNTSLLAQDISDIYNSYS